MSSRRGGGSGVGDGAAARHSSNDGDSVGPLPTTDVQRRAAARASARQKFRRAVHKVVAAKKVSVVFMLRCYVSRVESATDTHQLLHTR